MSKDCGYSDSKADRQGSQIRELEKKLKIATKALEFYGNEQNWYEYKEYISLNRDRKGKMARKALKDII